MQDVKQSKRQVKPPDPQGPRFRKVNFDILRDKNVTFYKDIKEQYPELKQYTNNDIANCIIYFNKRIAQEVLDNKNGVRLSGGLGVLVAGACKILHSTVANNIDFNALRKGKVVPFQNNGTDQYIAKIKYSSEVDKHMFTNSNMWCFDACRNFSRALAAIFKEEGGYKKYIVFTTKQHITHLFRKQRPKTINSGVEKNKKENLEKYDEFAF